MPGEVPGLSPTCPISLVKASAGKSHLCAPNKSRWLNRKGAPWNHRLPLEVSFASICFINCIALLFFLNSTAPLYRLIKSTSCYKGDLVLLP